PDPAASAVAARAANPDGGPAPRCAGRVEIAIRAARPARAAQEVHERVPRAAVVFADGGLAAGRPVARLGAVRIPGSRRTGLADFEEVRPAGIDGSRGAGHMVRAGPAA